MRAPARPAQAVHGGGIAMGERRAGPAREHRGEPAPVRHEHRMPDGIHAPMQTVKSPTLELTVDRPLGDAVLDELCPRDDPVLPRRETRNRTWDL
jgi:hypothetical protein